MTRKPNYEKLEQRVKELENEVGKRKRAEEALKESEVRYRTLVEQLPAITYTAALDETSTTLYVSPQIESMLGFSPKEYKEDPNIWDKQLHPEDRERVLKEVVSSHEGGSLFASEYRMLTKNGRTIWFTDEAIIVRDETGNPLFLQGLMYDITDRKRVEEKLRESEARYRILFQGAAEGILVADIETKEFKYANPAICRMLGYTEEELKRIGVPDIHPKEALEYVISEFEAQARGEKTLAASIPCLQKDGTTIYADINTTKVLINRKQCNVGFFTDITDRKRAEKEKENLQNQLQQAQKMEAIGTLAGGIAHDFNNLLMGIQGHASLMLLHIDSDHPHFERLKGIEDMVQTEANLTKQLLGFARGGKYEVKPTDLNRLIERSSEMFGQTKKEIKIHRKYQKEIWPVEVDRGQIEQVLLNLHVNAWHAMPRGGDLYIETHNVVLDEKHTGPFSVKPGNYVKISVTDTGVGMDEATRQRIFDPFFTTKEMGRGTGLGLASAYGIIKNHSGIINVYSEKGKGTTFNIYLPASEKEVITGEKKLADEILKGTETVLLVDDEGMILGVGEEMLKEMGYKVLLARSGKEAVEVYKANNDEIALVILDMIMPDMGGGEAYDRMKENNPKVKVLLSSGYSIEGQATEILERGCDGFIQKPFNIKELSMKIREILKKES